MPFINPFGYVATAKAEEIKLQVNIINSMFLSTESRNPPYIT